MGDELREPLHRTRTHRVVRRVIETRRPTLAQGIVETSGGPTRLWLLLLPYLPTTGPVSVRAYPVAWLWQRDDIPRRVARKLAPGAHLAPIDLPWRLVGDTEGWW